MERRDYGNFVAVQDEVNGKVWGTIEKVCCDGYYIVQWCAIEFPDGEIGDLPDGKQTVVDDNLIVDDCDGFGPA